MSDPHVGVMLHIGRRDRAEFLTPEEIAKRLQVPVRTVHEWCRTRVLPAFKVGKLWRITESDFEGWARTQARKEEKPKQARPEPCSVEVEIRKPRKRGSR